MDPNPTTTQKAMISHGKQKRYNPYPQELNNAPKEDQQPVIGYHPYLWIIVLLVSQILIWQGKDLAVSFLSLISENNATMVFVVILSFFLMALTVSLIIKRTARKIKKPDKIGQIEARFWSICGVISAFALFDLILLFASYLTAL